MSDYVWRFSQWESAPRPYEVISRTAKQLKVVGKSEYSGRRDERTVRLADMIGNGDWYASEIDAWEGRLAALEVSIDYTTRRLQQLRTQAGMVGSQLKKLRHAALCGDSSSTVEGE